MDTSVPEPKTAPAPTYEETVKQNKDLVTKRQLSLERALGEQQKLGANQLRAGGVGLKLF
jgi:hypothetical protein